MTDVILTQDYLRKALNYNPQTGVFTRASKTSNSVKVGSVAGCVNTHGYVVIRLLNKLFYAHRLAWLYEHGVAPEFEIDHINGKRSDNRIANLRDVTSAENSRNLSIRFDNKTGVVGVYWSSAHSKWASEIMDDKRKVFLGLFSNIEDAVCARKKAEVTYNYHRNHGKKQ